MNEGMRFGFVGGGEDRQGNEFLTVKVRVSKRHRVCLLCKKMLFSTMMVQNIAWKINIIK